MSRSLTATCIALCMLATASAAAPPDVPRVITYQGRITDAAGTALPDGPKSMRFMIWRDSTSTSPVNILWDSGPLTVTTDKGLFAVKLGQPPQPALDYLVAFDSLSYLGITVGADPEMSPRTRLSATPYAYTAENASNALSAAFAYSVDNNAVGTAQIADGSVKAIDLSADALPSVGVVQLSGTTTTGSVAALDSIIVNAPAAGKLLVTVNGRYWYDADAPSTTSIMRFPSFGLCTSPASSATCNSTYHLYYYEDPDNASTLNFVPSFTLPSVFSIPGPGSYVYYVNGSSGTAGELVSLFSGSHAVVQFFPASLTVSSSPKIENPNKPNSPETDQQAGR